MSNENIVINESLFSEHEKIMSLLSVKTDTTNYNTSQYSFNRIRPLVNAASKDDLIYILKEYLHFRFIDTDATRDLLIRTLLYSLAEIYIGNKNFSSHEINHKIYFFLKGEK